ncbi:MAG: hypothetical protein FWC00_00135 [Firmicutes bacterium]|nr:hypothetical protein [Bacillota bacterium]
MIKVFIGLRTLIEHGYLNGDVSKRLPREAFYGDEYHKVFIGASEDVFFDVVPGDTSGRSGTGDTMRVLKSWENGEVYKPPYKIDVCTLQLKNNLNPPTICMATELEKKLGGIPFTIFYSRGLRGNNTGAIVTAVDLRKTRTVIEKMDLGSHGTDILDVQITTDPNEYWSTTYVEVDGKKDEGIEKRYYEKEVITEHRKSLIEFDADGDKIVRSSLLTFGL